MDWARLWTSWSSAGLIVISTASIYASVILYTKIAGLRSLATMSSFDFAATVAIGATVATVANLASPTAHGLLVLGLLYLLQVAAALARRFGAERFIEVRAVVMGSTGLISVLTGDRGPEDAVLAGVRDADRLP